MKGNVDMATSSGCHLCPRSCGADRNAETGVCGADNTIRIAKVMPHFWEEPCVSGTRGSGAVFFSCCTLRCVYCQNRTISSGKFGIPVSQNRLAEIFSELRGMNVHNINLVSADQYAALIAPVLRKVRKNIDIPVVFNCSGYESKEMLDILDGLVDVYLPDFKYSDSGTAAVYSDAPDYPGVALSAIGRMLDSVGKPRFDSDGMLSKGVIVRHLVLPGHRKNSLRVIESLCSAFSPDDFIFSLMSQYTPNGDERAPSRRITHFEYESVANKAISYGLKGYFQQFSSADASYTPEFDGRGVLKV